jgi:hypothetical protein
MEDKRPHQLPKTTSQARSPPSGYWTSFPSKPAVFGEPAGGGVSLSGRSRAVMSSAPGFKCFARLLERSERNAAACGVVCAPWSSAASIRSNSCSTAPVGSALGGRLHRDGAWGGEEGRGKCTNYVLVVGEASPRPAGRPDGPLVLHRPGHRGWPQSHGGVCWGVL